MELDTKNILNVLHEAKFADADWELLGRQLISGTALRNITADRRGDPNHCMMDTVDQWLRTDTKASWEKLAGAVAKVERYKETTADIVRQQAGIAVKKVQPPERRQSNGKETGTSQQTVQDTHGTGTIIMQSIGDTTIIQNPVQPPSAQPPSAQPPPVQPPVSQGQARVVADSDEKKDPFQLQHEVTHSKQLVDAVAEAVDKVDNPRGLAVVVTNEYKNFPGDHRPGMKTDGQAMEDAFKSLGFATLWKPNKSSEEMKVLVKSVVKYFQDNPPPTHYVVAFVFSGHGGEGDLLIGEDNENVHLNSEIVQPLAEEREIGNIPKLFFINACRGLNELVALGRRSARELITAKGNYYVAYSTIPKHVAYTSGDPNSGSAWMQILAKNLQVISEPVSVIVETTNGELWKMYETHPEIRKWQQPESVDRLHCGPVYLRPKPDSPGVASSKRGPKRKGAGVASSKTGDGPKSLPQLRRGPKRKGAGVRDSLPPEKKKKSSSMQKHSQPLKGRRKKK